MQMLINMEQMPQKNHNLKVHNDVSQKVQVKLTDIFIKGCNEYAHCTVLQILQQCSLFSVDNKVQIC